MIARCTIGLALLAQVLTSPIALSQDAAAEVTTLTTEPQSAAVASETNSNLEQATEPAVAEQPQDAEAQAAKLKELLSLVQDNTLTGNRRENPAYFMLMKKVQDQTTEQLRDAVTLNPRFNDLYTKPSEYRGELVHVKLNARLVIPADYQNVPGFTRLYEIWGWTEEAKAWMYCCVVPELPEGFPEQGDIAKRIELTGYFFKMQAYKPGNAAPNARNLVAPLILGRIVDAGPLEAKMSNTMGHWPMILIIGFGSIVMFRLMLHLRGMGRTPPVRRNYRRRSLEPIDPDLVDEALDAPNRGIRIRNANEV